MGRAYNGYDGELSMMDHRVTSALMSGVASTLTSESLYGRQMIGVLSVLGRQKPAPAFVSNDYPMTVHGAVGERREDDDLPKLSDGLGYNYTVGTMGGSMSSVQPSIFGIEHARKMVF